MQSALDAPRHVIISARVSPMVELARWLFERHRIPYEEEVHAPLLHVLATRRRRGGEEVPVVITGESMWKGARELIYGLDSKLRPDESIFQDGVRSRQENENLVNKLLELLTLTVRRYVYYFLLTRPDVLKPIATQAAPAWESFVVRTFYSRWRAGMARALDFSTSRIEEAPARIRGAFDIVEAELMMRRSNFLGGDRPGSVDIIFSALVAPLVLPEKYGSQLPSINQLPNELRKFTDELRERRAGRLALETYAVARTTPQAPMAVRTYRRTLQQRLVTPAMQRLLARLAVKLDRPIKFRDYVVFARWQDVQEILHNDLHFQIAPVNGPKFDDINGPFILGLDRSPQFARERPIVYYAMSAIDHEEVRARVRADATQLLNAAVTMGSRIDVSHGYAHLVAARTAVHLFGIAGPTEHDLMRVCRAIFYHGFLNQSNDAAVAARAKLAFQDLRSWINAEIARRRQHSIAIDDVLGRIMRAGDAAPEPLDDDGVRRNLSGLLVGAIDTTTTAVSRIVAVLGTDPRMLARVEHDTDNRERMIGWCYEALRMWPDAPALLRRATEGAQLRGRPIRKDSLVVAFTQAAMYDGDVFPEPARVEPTRPLRPYMVFGGGLHPCAGRAVNNVQVPELVSSLVQRGIRHVGVPRFDGPFVDELLVDVGRQRA